MNKVVEGDVRAEFEQIWTSVNGRNAPLTTENIYRLYKATLDKHTNMCVISPFSSRVCRWGTKSCVQQHDKEYYGEVDSE